MPQFVIICQGDAANGQGPVGCYLQYYDPEGNKGFGAIQWCREAKDAMRFENTGEAYTEWFRQSVSHPFRASDGKPNRPLTAYNVSIEPLKDPT